MLYRWKLSRAARLIRLRSTLRSRPLLAALVRTLHVPDPHVPPYQANGEPNPEYDAYVCTIASVVMACPNLEALTGFYSFYNHTFDRLTHALSTRRKLRQHVWVIAENDDVTERGLTQLPPGLLDENQTYQFTSYHDRWKHLETLLLCSPGGCGVIEHEVFIRILHSLPALRNLCISSFDTDDFHDMTLLSLPPWVSTLRLEECLGVTDAGLQRWSANPNAAQMERLSLLHQNITSLLTLSKLFANMERLVKFTIVQNEVAPSLPNDMRGVVVHPVIASKSLQFLHWDISNSRAGAGDDSRNSTSERGQTTPNMHLAFSISHRGFPNLIALRAPRDTSPLGILQSVCQPVDDSMTLPDDTAQPYHYQQLRRSNSLRAARLRAQRITSHALGAASATNAPELLQPPPRNGNTVPQRKSNSDASVSTVSSLGTNGSRTSNRSGSSVGSSGRTPVSPLSTDQDEFSLLAPDDGIISPIAADQDRRYPTSRDWDKQAVTGPLKSRRQTVSKQDSVCRCTPSPAGNRDSICTCDAHDIPAIQVDTSAVTPPPRSPFRPKSVQVSDQSRTRFPSLALRPRQQARPTFYLQPDIPDHDGNGGLIGWGELLRISEKAKANTSVGSESNDQHRNSGTGLEDDSDEVESENTEKASTDMCTGSWARLSQSQGQLGDFPVIKKIISATSATSTKSGNTTRPRSKSKGASRLSLSRGAKTPDKPSLSQKPLWKHVARPRGDRARSVSVDDFF